jgi:uncharacterized protein with PIN domain
MIVVDSSALVAIFEHEPDAAVYASAILHADRLMISAVNVHETGMVMRARRGEAAERQRRPSARCGAFSLSKTISKSRRSTRCRPVKP